jgi:hypothetical protein
MTRKTGRCKTVSAGGETVAAFVPDPLPPRDPPLALDGDLADRLAAAERALGLLDLAADMVPSLDWFLYGWTRSAPMAPGSSGSTTSSTVWP